MKLWTYRSAAHYIAGILICLSSSISWVLPVIGTAMFLVYEIDEDWHLYDQAYHDILECMLGFFVAVGIFLIYEVIV